MTGPWMILPFPLATPPRSCFVSSGTAVCADGPRSHQVLAASPRTCATSTSRVALEISHWRAAMPAIAAPRLFSLPPTVRDAARATEFEGEANRLGGTGAVSAREAAASRSTAMEFVGPTLGLGRAVMRTDGSFLNTSEGALQKCAVQRTAHTMPLQAAVMRPRGASGRGFPVPSTSATRRSPRQFIGLCRTTPATALGWTATRGIVAYAAARLGRAK